METKLVLSRHGTPNACPNARVRLPRLLLGIAYLVDFDLALSRQASKAYFNGIDALRPDLFMHCFLYPSAH